MTIKWDGRTLHLSVEYGSAVAIAAIDKEELKKRDFDLKGVIQNLKDEARAQDKALAAREAA